MLFRVTRAVLGKASLREKFWILTDIVTLRLREAIPHRQQVLRKLLRKLVLQGARIEVKPDRYVIEPAENEGYRFALRRNTSDVEVAWQVLGEEEYGPLIRLVSEHGGAIETVMDAGANIGCATLFLRGHFPGARYFLLEPDPENFTALSENLGMNRFEGVFSLQAALWTKDEPVTLSRDFRDGEAWSIRVESPAQAGPGTVEGRALPGLMAQWKIGRIDILKVDIEGAEAALFSPDAHPEQFLAKVKYLAMEIHPETGRVEEILQVLEANGFEMKKIGEAYFGFNRRLDARLLS